MSRHFLGVEAPNLTFTDLQNNPIALSSLRGEPVLLNFITSNCTWCRSEMVNLAYVFRRLDNVQIKILGVLVGQNATTAAQFAAEQNLDITMVTDVAGEAQNAFQLQRVPTLVFIDASGQIACVYEGATEQLA